MKVKCSFGIFKGQIAEVDRIATYEDKVENYINPEKDYYVVTFYKDGHLYKSVWEVKDCEEVTV